MKAIFGHDTSVQCEITWSFSMSGQLSRVGRLTVFLALRTTFRHLNVGKECDGESLQKSIRKPLHFGV